MYSVVPTRTGRPDAEVCVAEAVRPMAARPKSHSLTLPSAQIRTFSGLRSRYRMARKCKCFSPSMTSAA